MPAKQANSPQIFTDNYISQFSGQRKGSIFSLSLIQFYFYRKTGSNFSDGFKFCNLSVDKARNFQFYHIAIRNWRYNGF